MSALEVVVDSVVAGSRLRDAGCSGIGEGVKIRLERRTARPGTCHYQLSSLIIDVVAVGKNYS